MCAALCDHKRDTYVISSRSGSERFHSHGSEILFKAQVTKHN